MTLESLKMWFSRRRMPEWHPQMPEWHPHMPEWHPHMPNRHDMALRFEHITHNERFWLVVTLTVLFALLIFFAILGAVKGGGAEQPIYPHFPIMP